MKPPRAFRLTVASCAVAGASLVGGCLSTYEVRVDSVAPIDLRTNGVGFYQVRTNRETSEADRGRFERAEQRIKSALAAQGWYEAADGKQADMIVEIDYAIAPPRVVFEEFHRPLYARSFSETDLPPAPWTLATTEIVGHARTFEPVILHEKRLSVSGYDNRVRAANTPPRQIWRIEVSVEDESADLRRSLPVLAAAARAQIARN